MSDDDPLAHIERGVPLAWTRMRRVYLAVIAVVIVLLLVSTTVAVFAMMRLGDVQATQREVQANQRTAICRAKINAQFFAGVADAFLAPPAPNPARTTAASEIKHAAAQLHNTAKVCGP